MVLREHNDPLNQSRGIMGPLENSTGINVQNNRGRLRQRFDLIRKLGQGTYGKVQLGIDKETGQEVAIKTIKKSKIETEADLIRIRREIQIMSSVRHPNIIHIYEVFENREKMVLVMEYAAGGELYDYLNERKILQEDEARRIFRQIASAVYYCHKHKICHRDLKLENILLDEQSNAKIADFGLSNVFDDVHLLKTFCGSPLYASPEIVKGSPYYGPEVDCWSLGVLLYTLVYGAMPFDGSNFKRLVKQISNGDYYEPKKPAEASPLIRIMLTVDPLTRATIKDVCSHVWINQSFDKACLNIAEDLANQTPVRLDLLLSLAPAYNINHSQVVIESPAGAAEGAAAAVSPATLAAAATHATNAVVNHEKPTKDKRMDGKERGVEVPPKPKRKQQQVKTKSKSSPLLELIMDEEDEAEGENDDEGDTLSEISEIQTIAEDLAEVKSKGKIRESKDKLQQPKVSVVVKPEKVGETVAKHDKNGVPASTAKAIVAETKGVAEKMLTTKKAVLDKKDTVETAAASAPKKAEEKVIVEIPKTPIVKRKVVKVKQAETPAVTPPPPTAPAPPSPIVLEEKAKKEEEKMKKEVTARKEEEKVTNEVLSKSEATPAPEVDPKEEKAKKEEKVQPKKETTPASDGSGKEDKTSDKEKEETPSRPKLVKQRSDSGSEVSPTRIERRNSKVISQKTAELIQNLNTKTSTNSTSEPAPKAKKLVIPSFTKVSDAKSRFEMKPPRPVNPASSLSKSRAAIEAKFNQQQSQPTEKEENKKLVKSAAEEKDKIPEPKAGEVNKKCKSKSPSPLPDTAASTNATSKPNEEAKTNSISTTLEVTPTVEAAKSPTSSPKQKPKLAKKPIVDKEESIKREIVNSPEPSTLSEDASTTTTTDDKTVSTVSQATPTITEVSIKSVKVTKPVTKAEPNQQMKPVVMDNGTGAPKTAMMLVKGKTTSPFQSPQETSTDPGTASESNDEKQKTKLLTKLPPQNKEQAAKKISSVITKIVTSGSADKGLNEDKKFSTLPRNAKLVSNKPEIPTLPPGPIKSEIVVETGKPSPKTQKAEVSFPVAAAASVERIIPIKLTDDSSQGSASGTTSRNTSNTQIPRLPPRLDSFKRMDSTNSTFSRQNSSDTESSMALPKPEPIRKSPREFLIPIKIEESGQTVTPKEELAAEASAGSLSSMAEDDFRMDSRLRSGRFGRQKRYSSLLSDSSLDDEPSVSASTSRRSSAVGGSSLPPSHARSRSQGDEPDTSSTGGTFKRYRMRRSDMPLDRSDSFSSAEEDEEDAFEVLTAESLFSNLLDRVRNLTRRLNREDSVGPSWASTGSDPPGFAIWGTSPLREFMTRAPSESRSYSSTTPGSYSMNHHRAFSREPSVTVTMNPGAGGWRRSLSRELSGDSDSHSASATSHNAPTRNLGGVGGRRSDIGEINSVRSLPLNLASARRSSPSFYSQRSDGGDSSISSSTTGGYHPHPTSRQYGRTMSNTDFASPTSTHTLPFHRRSLKSFERSYSHNDRDREYPSSTAMSPQVDSMVGAVRGIASRLLEPSSFNNTSGSSYLARMRSISRETPDRERERSVGPLFYNSSKNDLGPGISTGECNGWVGGSNSSLATSNNSNNGSATKMSVQEKMNNYHQFYHSLSNNISPEMRRFQLLNPSQQVHQHSSANAPPRPNTMYETSFINCDTVYCPNQTTVTTNSEASPSERSANVSFTPSPLVSPPSFSPVDVKDTTVRPPPSATISPTELTPAATNKEEVAANTSAVGAKATSPTTTTVPCVPKWPNVSIKQHRPLSISSFPNNNNNNNSEKSKSIARNAPPPPPPPDSVASVTTNIPTPIASTTNANTIIENANVKAANTNTNVIPANVNANANVVSANTSVTAAKTNTNVTVAATSSANTNAANSHTNVNASSASDGNNKTATNPPSTPKLKREVRATSVDRITRFLERKSTPREIPPASEVKSVKEKDKDPTKEQSTEGGGEKNQSSSTEKCKSSSKGSSKPKFLQSLEKKWEKLTTSSKEKGEPLVNGTTDHASPSESPVPPHDTPEPSVSEDSLTEEINGKQVSESVLLQRAVSPEKKPKSKFGASTVNFMLGKFRKFEENTNTPLAQNNSFSRIPSGKPPTGNAASRVGRRVQSVYAGAASDSVLSFPRESPPQPKVTKAIANSLAAPTPAAQPICNGHKEPDVESPVVTDMNSIKEDAVELIKSAEVAQMKRRSVVTHTLPSAIIATDNGVAVATSEAVIECPPPVVMAPGEGKPRRPHSLGIFSSSNGVVGGNLINGKSATSLSFIPRFQRQSNVTITNGDKHDRLDTNGDTLSPVEKLSPKQLANVILPEINIQDTFSNHSTTENGDDTGLSPLTPTSVSDSYDSSSVCSERTEQSKERAMSVLDEEESVSDRIFRKSFYNRFNSLDRKRSASASAAVRQMISPSPSRQSSINGNHKSNGSKVNSASSSMGTSGIMSGLASSGTNTSGGISSSSGGSGGQRSPSPNLLLNKYNPNPLFKELITDEYKSDVGRKAEYSRRVTSKLSKLLREIDSDIKSCNLKDSSVLNGSNSSNNDSHNNDLINNLVNKVTRNNSNNQMENGHDLEIDNSFSLESEK